MSMSKVTLLGRPGNTYTIQYGARAYEFLAGRARKVPVVIALEARKKTDRRGSPLFSVEDLPEIVGSASAGNPTGESGEQNVSAEEQQQTFGL